MVIIERAEIWSQLLSWVPGGITQLSRPGLSHPSGDKSILK